MTFSDGELGWIAGFIEGEGSFQWAGHTPSVVAVQVQYWPVEKLKSLCGGNIVTLRRDEVKSNGGIHYRWYIYGDKAIELIKAIYPLLSPKRKEQAKAIYTKRVQQEQPKPERTHCKRGHLWADNEYIPNGKKSKRICRACRLELQRTNKE